MKTNFIAKHKWWALTALFAVVLMAVSVSYCAWDTLSAKASLSGGSGRYEKDTISLVEDKDGNRAISVGDIVEYGRFYQEADAITTHETTPLKWVVVDYNASTKVASLLTEKVVIFGNFWGDVINEQSYSVNYYHSTARSWLNSGKGSLKGSGTTWKDSDRYVDNVRNDGVGSAFGLTQENQVNKGFLDVAFSDNEKSILIPKRIDDLQTIYPTGSPHKDATTTTDGRTFINDLIWMPSLTELFGSSLSANMTFYEGTPKLELSYFKGTVHGQTNQILACGATDYARDARNTSYYNNGNENEELKAKNATIWGTRSPDFNPTDRNDPLIISANGSYTWTYSYFQNLGLRPGVCIQL